MDEVLCEFIAESWESLNQLDADIVELEKRHGDPELLASVFRTIHTIKGTCGFIGLTRLGALAHSTENVLGQMREGKLEPSSDAFSITLRAIDEIKEVMLKSETAGMMTFDTALLNLYNEGKISYEEALKNADSKNNLALKIKLSGKKQPPKQATNTAPANKSAASPAASQRAAATSAPVARPSAGLSLEPKVEPVSDEPISQEQSAG